MGRVKPLNGTVGVTKPKVQEVKAELEAGNTTAVEAFLNEAIAVCESNEYMVLTAEGTDENKDEGENE